jgi:hypothetical protein
VVWSIGLTTGHETGGTGAGAGSLETRGKELWPQCGASLGFGLPPSRQRGMMRGQFSSNFLVDFW